jgi:hypothetical protein
MTSRHSKDVRTILQTLEENMTDILLLQIGDNTVVREDSLSDQVRSLRPDLNIVTQSFGSSHMILIDISWSCTSISYGANTLEKVYVEKKEKYSRLARAISNIQEIGVEIIPIIVS